MWLSALPDQTIRQGDLIAPIGLPSPKYEIDEHGVLSSPPKGVKHALVITQCCTIEQRKSVTVVPVSRSSKLDPASNYYHGLMTELSPDLAIEGSLPYVFDAFALDPIEGLLEPLTDNRLWLADLTESITIKGSPQWLVDRRLARMTPAGREQLRVKLQFFFGRVEDTDADALGIPL